MPVSHEYQCVFVHIPKCAGTSIEYALGMHGELQNVGLEPYLNQQVNDETLFGKGMQHLSADELRASLGNEIFSSYYKFAVVRNPWSRFVSHVAWGSDATGQMKWHRGVAVSLEEMDQAIMALQKNTEGGGGRHPHLREQWPMISDEQGNALMDEVIKIEELEEGWKKVCAKLGIDIPLEQRMRSVHKAYREYFSEKSAKLIGEVYRTDCEMFGYEF